MPYAWASSFSIGSQPISLNHPTFIIAEIGINHQGSLTDCLHLIDAAAAAGANAVKLQTIKADLNYAPGTTSHSLFKSAELSDNETEIAFRHAKSLGLECFSTCSDKPSIDLIHSLNPCAWKISSGLLTHIPLISKLARLGKPLLLSTGLASIAEIVAASEAVWQQGNPCIAVLQCTSLYPAPFDEIHLNSLATISKTIGCLTGYSDHAFGSIASTTAVALGARILEKHISLDVNLPSFDHHISLDPPNFSQYVQLVRQAESCLGLSSKPIPIAVISKRRAMLRVLASPTDLPSSHTLTEQDVIAVRVSVSDSTDQCYAPSYIDHLIGKRLRTPITAYAPFQKNCFYD